MARRIHATLPNGKVVYRETERPYTHVIAAFDTRFGRGWFAYRWTQNLERAIKEIPRFMREDCSDFTPCPTSVVPRVQHPHGAKRGRNWHTIYFWIPETADKHVRQINDMCRYARAEIWIEDDERTVRLTFKSFKPEEIIARAKTFGWRVIKQ
ncbi:MAG: hypothetical protein MOGMAGMI_02497 [Candidatus Omnitrophica bacterium]|nr:hypothetical protein [Candidatus Omnitrophota bacterium]